MRINSDFSTDSVIENWYIFWKPYLKCSKIHGLLCQNPKYNLILLKPVIDHVGTYVPTCFATNGENQFSDLEWAHQQTLWLKFPRIANENSL